jgi:hypothetical protein
MFDLDTVITWIEEHDKTVDLLKWVLLLVLAWATGLFRYLRNLARKPRARLSSLTSRCYVEPMEDKQHSHAVLAAFLVELEVTNLGSDPIVVRTMELRMRRLRPFLRWGPWISATSLPNRVQLKMDSGIKVFRNWFSNFPDGPDSLTIQGRIAPKDAASGFLLFVSSTYGSWNPKIVNDCVLVRGRVTLTTGEKLTAVARIPVTTNAESFESLIPNGLVHVRDRGTWNLPAR